MGGPVGSGEREEFPPDQEGFVGGAGGAGVGGEASDFGLGLEVHAVEEVLQFAHGGLVAGLGSGEGIAVKFFCSWRDGPAGDV